MMKQRIAEAFLVTALLSPALAFADVKTQEKSQMKFEGGLGRMMGMFGGKMMKDGIVSTAAVKGDRKLTITDTTGQIIDLKEEKVYDLDLDKRTYRVTTFAELRQRLEEARKKAAEEPMPTEQKVEQRKDGKEIEVDFDLKETGQKRTINGFDAREIVMTVVAREKGKTLQQSGGMVMTTSTWLTPNAAALKEMNAFDLRYAEKVYGPLMADGQQMAMALGMYPMLKDAMARMQKEQVKLDGTAVLTIMKAEAVASAEQAAAAQKEEAAEPAAPTSTGGLGGMLGRRMMKRGNNNAQPTEPSTPGRATIVTMQHEVMSITPVATDADVAIPAGFKEKK
jgi:hypothetical protein